MLRLKERRPAPRSAAEGRRSPVFEIVHAGVTYRVAVKRVGTARRFTLRVRAATHDTVLTMPSSASLRTARAFVERHVDWMRLRLSGLPNRAVLGPGALLPLRGVEHELALHDAGLSRAETVEVHSSTPGLRPVLRVPGPPDLMGQRLHAFLRREARRDLERSVEAHAPRIGKPYARIVVRESRTRWGSCSSKGTLSFSWRLVLAPSFVLDYLAAHEVAHLVHMNHSAAFWAVTRALAPRMDEAELWLKTHGPTLHRYVVP